MLPLEQRFWALFAILFGAGFAVQLARSKARESTFIPLYLRRLPALAAFGLIAEGLFGYNVLAFAIRALPLLLVRNWLMAATDSSRTASAHDHALDTSAVSGFNSRHLRVLSRLAAARPAASVRNCLYRRS